jgi:glycosyltransferase involved in cell wall biosynthesis
MADGSRPPQVSLRVLQTGLNWFGSGSGGLDRVFSDLALSLPAQGVQVRGLVVSPENAGSLTDGQVQAYAPAASGFGRRMLAARARIAQAARARTFDVIAPHFALHVATALDHLRDAPMVVHFHGPWALESRAEGAGRATSTLKYRLERMVYRRADRLIVLSQAFGTLLVQEYGVPSERVRIVPGAVDLDRFATGLGRQQARARLGWPTDRPILLSVRRLAARMGLERLIEAMPAIVRRVPDVLLVLAGKGRLEPALRQRVAELQLEAHVRFAGFVPESDLAVTYTAADLHVVPSLSLEGFGLSAAEALAAGTPSLVTPVGGLPDVVSGLSADLVLPSTAQDAIEHGVAGALLNLARIPGPAACRAHAEAHFQVSRAAAQVAAIYREAAGR